MASLDFVPEEQVTLRELKLLETELLDERNTNAVERRKQPAAPRALLVGHRLALGLNLQEANSHSIIH